MKTTLTNKHESIWHAALLALIIAFVLPGQSKGQAVFEPYYDGALKIDWRPNMLNAYSFYRVPPGEKREWGALTWWFMEYKSRVENTGSGTVLVLYLRACFLKGKQSYIMPGSMKNAWLIKHEQGHMDIAEIYTRYLGKAFKAANFTRSNHQQLAGQLYSKYFEAAKATQIRYDNETAHNLNRPKQEMWNRWCQEQLAMMPAVSIVRRPL